MLSQVTNKYSDRTIYKQTYPQANSHITRETIDNKASLPSVRLSYCCSNKGKSDIKIRIPNLCFTVAIQVIKVLYKFHMQS